jgi:hypothetical protein
MKMQPSTLANLFGLGRLAIRGAFMVSPVMSVRVLGVDTATAKRMTFLARMTAARDIALGAGALATRDPGGKAVWIAAGAASDAVDAAVIGLGVKEGTTSGFAATSMVGLAAGASVLGLWTAAKLAGPRRRLRGRG